MFCLSPLRERLPACPVAQRCRRRLDHLGGGLSAPRPSCPLLLLTRSLLRQAAYCDPGLISEVGTFIPEQKPTSSISLLIALRLISCAASFDEQVRAPLHLDAPRWRKPLQQDARAQSLKMGAGAIFKDWVRVLTLSRARAGSTSPTRSAGRSLPTSRCGRPPPALPVIARLTPLTPPQKISLVCAACLKTDEPEKYASIQTRAAVRHSLSRSLCRFAGARTSSPRYGTTRLSEKRALHSPTLLLSRLADAALAVVQQDGDCQGHPCRCAYLLPCWSPDSEHVCAQN